MASFGPKPWVNPFGKISIFRLFEFLVFIAQKGVFSFQNIVKDFFLTNSAEKKIFEKWPYLDQNHGLTLLEKLQYLKNFELLVFLAQKGVFFFLEYRKSGFPNLNCLKRKVGKMAKIQPKPWVNPFGKMSISLTF